MTSTGAVAGVAFLAYLEHPLAPRPRPGQIVVLDRLGGAPQTGGAGGDRSAGVRVGAVAWVRPGLQPQRVGFQQDRGVRESCGGEDEGERWTLRSRLRWGRCRWGMWWVGLSMPESRITHCEDRCKRRPPQLLLRAPVRPQHPHGRDGTRPRRAGAPRAHPLPGGQQLGGLADREGARYLGARAAGALRTRPADVQPGQTPSRGRDPADGGCRTAGRHPLQPTGRRAADRQVRHRRPAGPRQIGRGRPLPETLRR